MKREKLFLSTMDADANLTARRYGLGLELTEFSIPWNLDKEREHVSRQVTEKIKYTGQVLIHGPYSELFPCAVEPYVRQVAAYRFRQSLHIAKYYGAPKVIFHGGFNEHLYYPVWYQEKSVEFWKRFADDIPDGITVCLENVLEPTPELLGDIIRQVNDPRIRMCLDVGHANAYSKADPEQWLSSCGDIISHVHVHNNDGTKDTHSQLTEGNIPMESLFHKLQDIQATVTLEINEAEPSIQWLLDNKILED